MGHCGQVAQTTGAARIGKPCDGASAAYQSSISKDSVGTKPWDDDPRFAAAERQAIGSTTKYELPCLDSEGDPHSSATPALHTKAEILQWHREGQASFKTYDGGLAETEALLLACSEKVRALRADNLGISALFKKEMEPVTTEGASDKAIQSSIRSAVQLLFDRDPNSDAEQLDSYVRGMEAAVKLGHGLQIDDQSLWTLGGDGTQQPEA